MNWCCRNRLTRSFLIILGTFALSAEKIVAFERSFQTRECRQVYVDPIIQRNHPSRLLHTKINCNLLENNKKYSSHEPQISVELRRTKKLTSSKSTLDRIKINPSAKHTSLTLLQSTPKWIPLVSVLKSNAMHNLFNLSSSRKKNKADTCDKRRHNDQNKVYLFASMMPIASFIQFYSYSIQNAPILTKSITAGIIFSLSDWLAQRIVKIHQQTQLLQNTTQIVVEINGIQWSRIIASGIVGLFYYGPAAHYWYEWIFHLIPGMTFYDSFKKATLAQLLFDPIFTSIYFASSLIQVRQFTLYNWWIKIKNDLPGVTLAGIGFWPLIEIIGFTYIPKQYLPIFISCCSFIWTIYLAAISNEPQQQQPVT